MKQLMKRWLALGMSFAMAFTMIPAGSGDVVKADEVESEVTTPYEPLVKYDFSDYTKTDDNTLTGTKGDTIALESEGTGEKPALVEDSERGQVLELKYLAKGLNDKGTAVVSNPFEGDDMEDGLTINFWTKTKKKDEHDGCLISFELAPKSGSTMASAFDINQRNIRWNATAAGGEKRYADIDADKLGVYNSETWKMVTMTVTKNELKFYSNGTAVTYNMWSAGEDAYKTNYEEMMKDLTGVGAGVGSVTGENGKKTKVRLGGTFVAHWPSAGALIDEVSFYGKALTGDEILSLYKSTGPAVKSVAINSTEKIVEIGKTLPLSISVLPETITMDRTPTWESKDTSILTVSEDGTVTGVSEGTTSVVATLGGVASAEYEITVVDAVQGQLIELLKGYSFKQKNVTADFTLPNTMALPDGESSASISWESKDESLIKIENNQETGTITAKVIAPKEAKRVVLTATAAMSGKTASKDYEVIARPEAVIGKSAVASYDFADYTKTNDSTLTGKDNTTITLQSVGKGKKPELIYDDMRGQVLSLTENPYEDRAFALLPANPFAGKSIDDGFALNFWTKTTGDGGGARCLVDFELAPASTGKRAGTLAVNQQMIYWNTTDQGGAERFTDFATGNLKLSKDNGWTMVTVAFTKTGITLYRNGSKISHTISKGTADYENMIKDLTGNGAINTDPTKTNVRLGASLAEYWSCAGALMDDVSFYEKALSAAEIATLYQETLIPVELESVTISGNHSVEEDSSISLTASVQPTNTTVDRTVTWKSSDETVLKVNANGSVRGVSPGSATITATIAGVESAPFEITVTPVEGAFQDSLAAGKYILVYSTTTPFYAETANLAQETRSVYMAVSEDGKNFEVLNNGGGVIFSKNTSGTLQITKPRITIDTEGNFTVIAPDATASKGYHVFTSEDGVHYYDDTLASTNKTYATLPQLRKSSIQLLLKGENILDTDDAITLGNAVALTDEQYTYIVNKLGTVVNTGLKPLETLKITSDQADTVTESLLGEMYPDIDAFYSDGSTQNFKIDWNDALNGVDLTQDGDHTISGTVVQPKYLNNLEELNNSTLPDDDPANVPAEGESFPDNYDPETGKVYYDSTKFIEGMADPNIFWDEETQYYYMTASYFPEEGDAIDKKDVTEQYDRVVLRRGKTLEELQTRSNQITIWKAGNQGYDDNGTAQSRGYRYIWAPEIHRVGDYWVVYFTESHSTNAFNIFSHALVLDGDINPYDTALTASDEVSQWKDYKMCVSSSVGTVSGSDIPRDPFSNSFCLDMTYFKDEVNGKSYVIWAGTPTAAYQGGNTDLFIATVDEAHPWIITSNAVRLTKADYGWERVRFCVNEGATILQKDGKIFMCYSVSGTGSEYAIGMLSAEGGKDLLDTANWIKSPYPLLTSRDVNGEEGPGHNSFTVDKDGNAIFVYHARPTSHNYQACGQYNGEPLNDPCRHARLKRVHWAADGTPILKMTYEDELLDEYKTVTLTINVGDGGSDLPIPVSSVALSEDELSLEVGEESTLKATVLPEAATHKTLSWDSSNPSVATVAEGKITAKAAGTTTITATAVSGVSATCEVTVTAKGGATTDPTGLTLNKTTLSLDINGTETLKATVAPEGASYEGIEWMSSDSDTVSVEADTEETDTVRVVAKKSGNVTITASIKGTDITATCEVTVSDVVETITGIELDKKAISLEKDSSENLTFTVKPEGIYYDEENITWASDAEAVATVDAGMVTAVGKGTANITVTIKDTENNEEFSDTCVVTVTETNTSDVPVTEVKLNKTSLELKVGAEETLTATISPSNATNQTVTWKSSDTTVASVDTAGKVKALKAGSTDITATAGAVTATCKVTVTDNNNGTGSGDIALTGITLSKKTLKLGVKETFTLKATLKPANTTVKTAVSWKSSNTKVATVNKNGKITTKKKGKATITASIGNIKATCEVTVCAAPTKITLKKTKVSLKKGRTAQISVKAFKPKKAYCTIFTYTSKNKKVATVSKTGKITAKKKGTTTITVTCKNNKKAKATVKVTVK